MTKISDIQNYKENLHTIGLGTAMLLIKTFAAVYDTEKYFRHMNKWTCDGIKMV